MDSYYDCKNKFREFAQYFAVKYATFSIEK